MKIKLINKAKNLDIIKDIFKSNNKIIIPLYFYFEKRELKKKKKLIINKIYKFNKKKELILRSSAVSEDQSQNSQAGKYDSVTIKKKRKKI